jgi:hypothetical protein
MHQVVNYGKYFLVDGAYVWHHSSFKQKKLCACLLAIHTDREKAHFNTSVLDARLSAKGIAKFKIYMSVFVSWEIFMIV